MKMNKEKAGEVLGLSGSITPEQIKKRYRELSLKYHPDLWPNGQHMQSMINAAYETLKGFSGDLEEKPDVDIAAHIGSALFALSDLPGLEFEICGTWLWVTGDHKAHTQALKDAGLRHKYKSERWYLGDPGQRKRRSRRPWSHSKIQNVHGSQNVNKSQRSNSIKAIA